MKNANLPGILQTIIECILMLFYYDNKNRSPINAGDL